MLFAVFFIGAYLVASFVPSFESKISHPLRPKSASRVGDRLSKGGHPESCFVANTEYEKLQEKYFQMSQERDSLRASLSRAEEEKKRIIHEGDEDVQKLQNQKDSEIRYYFVCSPDHNGLVKQPPVSDLTTYNKFDEYISTIEQDPLGYIGNSFPCQSVCKCVT